MTIIAILITSAIWLFLFKKSWLPSAQAEDAKIAAEIRAERDRLRATVDRLLGRTSAPPPPASSLPPPSNLD